MAREADKLVYRERSKRECINTHLRNCAVVRLLVRGNEKVRAVLLWVTVAHNLLRALALHEAAAQAAASG